MLKFTACCALVLSAVSIYLFVRYGVSDGREAADRPGHSESQILVHPKADELAVCGVKPGLAYTQVAALHGEPDSFELNPPTAYFNKHDSPTEVSFCTCHGNVIWVAGGQLVTTRGQTLRVGETRERCRRLLGNFDSSRSSDKSSDLYRLRNFEIDLRFSNQRLENVGLLSLKDCHSPLERLLSIAKARLEALVSLISSPR